MTKVIREIRLKPDVEQRSEDPEMLLWMITTNIKSLHNSGNPEKERAIDELCAFVEVIEVVDNEVLPSGSTDST